MNYELLFDYLFQAQIYPPTKFARYNMFNHHFFDPEGKENLSVFLHSGSQESSRVILVNDPPFGGMVGALSASLASLEAIWASRVEETGAFVKDKGSLF